MSALGLALLPLLAFVLVKTGLPAYSVLILGAVVGAVAGVATGTIPLAALGAMPPRLIGLLESDILQALPLFVLMGALLQRLQTTELLFRLVTAPLGSGPRAARTATLLLGALLGPMNGSVGASVGALGRATAPALAKSGASPADAQAMAAIAGTLGVVIPPSLVLILLGDALLSAHTIAVNQTGRAQQIINTQDVFRSVIVPAGMFLALSLLMASLWPANRAAVRKAPEPAHLGLGEVAIGLAVLGGVVALLAGVALGRIYAVEAAATGAMALLAVGFATGRLGGSALPRLLTDVLITTGVLFAPLIAATTFTLVLRLLGTDKLLEAFLIGLPGGSATAVLVVLALIAASAIVLDAFEIVFVMVPILVPPLLVREPDAAWVAVLLLLTLQASFLMPPIGYALAMARSTHPEPAPLGAVVGAAAPWLAVQAAVLAAVVAMPALVHLLDPVAKVGPGAPSEASRAERQQKALDALPKKSLGGPRLPVARP